MVTKAILNIEPLNCPSCAKKVENLLKSEAGISQVTVLAQLGKVRLEFAETEIALERVKRRLGDAGYPVLSEGGMKA